MRALSRTINESATTKKATIEVAFFIRVLAWRNYPL
ncbi:hypothetical protein PANA5342_4168 [Pantoea ananatis LMG 5342]|nr:hypothetical protein PANA5342_4168 [Pantoea ananatis LMG 5342]